MVGRKKMNFQFVVAHFHHALEPGPSIASDSHTNRKPGPVPGVRGTPGLDVLVELVALSVLDARAGVELLLLRRLQTREVLAGHLHDDLVLDLHLPHLAKLLQRQAKDHAIKESQKAQSSSSAAANANANVAE